MRSALIGSFFALIVVAGAATVSDSCSSIDTADKVDCGFDGVNEDSCVARGCCWLPVYGAETSDGNKGIPWCFYASTPTSISGYSLVEDLHETDYGLEATLKLRGESSAVYGPDVKELQLQFWFESEDILRVKIFDAYNNRWEIPESVVKRSHAASKPASTNYEILYPAADEGATAFSFEVVRKADGKSLFKSSEALTFKDQFIELTTATAASSKMFGLGESARMQQALKRGGSKYTMWAADIPALVMNSNLYGSFPFYLEMSAEGTANGAMLFNSNGIDVILEDAATTFRTIGGVIDLYIFAGSTPSQVVQQYTQIVGRPAMMPYWSLGFHNCKYGYTDIGQVKEVVANYSAAKIPLDTQWFDIDYMQAYRDFTLDGSAFPAEEVAAFVDSLHENGQHFVPIVDPGIMVYPGYDAYETGLKQDLFIKDISGGYYMSQVWPGPTYFPDFFHPAAQPYWTEQIQAFWEAVEIDGLWIDMNEVSNFCNSNGAGQVCENSAPEGCPAAGASQTDCCLVCSTVDAANKLDFPPYQIGNHQGNGLLSTKTLAMSATHYGNVTAYDAHNLYGLTEQIATNAALTEVRGKRPFLLTRSSFMSTGVHSAKWTGDNGATWDDLKSSIVSIMDFSLFGVPMVGADICGFIYDTTEELCARWIEVGAFYPFARNHNTLGAAPQELYLWDTVTEAARNALGMRYQLLPYLYTQFYRAHTQGEMVSRALWVNFPQDAAAVSVDAQFMLGAAVLVSPVLAEGARSVEAYFPWGYWYSFADRTLAVDATTSSFEGEKEGVWETLDTPLTATNVHVRGGQVLALQEAAMTTVEGRRTPFTLLAALCPGNKAAGDLFWDDGEQVTLNNFLTASFSVEVSDSAGSVSISAVSVGEVVHRRTNNDLPALGTIEVLGKALQKPAAVVLNGRPLAASSVEWEEERGALIFSLAGLGLSIADDITLTWTF